MSIDLENDLKNVVRGNLEVVDQLIEFVESLSEEDYRFNDSELFMSSIGQHLRHILDLYQVMIEPQQEDLVDYDVRRRGLALESEKEAGLVELRDLRSWLEALPVESLKQGVLVKTEVLLSETCSVQLPSTFARELVFTASHLTHHLALMVTIAKVIGHKVDDAVGLAPATNTFVENSKTEAA
ncbi:DinB family protein [Endozoicomonas sp. OPT23]|uniref:DinB family protein n=1 Tax=Endozoicomonas sp. OPT23 TaxID=2072845 RepID=UPI00189164E4|nr:DinB family protein [Endozoicomonas sp. OPT23]